MSTTCQLAPMIETVASRLAPSLVCRDNVESILTIARAVPSWQCAGFECRLGAPAPRADFGVHLRRQHGMPFTANAAGSDAGGTEARDPAAADAWQRLRRFADAWADRRTLIAQAIPAVSLEFDTHEERGARLAAPSMFVSMRFGPRGPGRPAGTCRTVVDAVLEALGVDAGGALATLNRCLEVLLPKVPFLQLGVWLARPVDTFRICAPGLALRDIPAVVRALRWSGPADAYAAHWRELLEFGHRGALHLDVGTGISPTMGLEVNFGEASASWRRHDPDDTRFFDYLVEKDMCLRDKRDDVLSWVGGFRVEGGSGADDAALFLRTVSHVKLVFQPDRLPQAKAYLAVGRVDRQTEH